MQDIDFWFDFSSGYAYFAALAIEDVAARHGRSVRWRPYMLGTAFKVTGATGLSSTPLKRDYAQRDWARLARLLDVPFAPPANHPIIALPATRAFYWLGQERPEVAPRLARRVFDAYYGDGADLSDPGRVAGLAVALEVDEAALLDGLQSDAIKAVAKARSEEAITKGVFGSPFFIVDGEPFWGWDRLPMLEDRLSRGGW